jgi:hypothetical protein
VYTALFLEQCFQPGWREPSPGLREMDALIEVHHRLSAQVETRHQQAIDAASKPRVSRKQRDTWGGPPVTGEQLRRYHDEYRAQHNGNDRAWMKNAAAIFGLDPKTVRKKMKE